MAIPSAPGTHRSRCVLCARTVCVCVWRERSAGMKCSQRERGSKGERGRDVAKGERVGKDRVRTYVHRLHTHTRTHTHTHTQTHRQTDILTCHHSVRNAARGTSPPPPPPALSCPPPRPTCLLQLRVKAGWGFFLSAFIAWSIHHFVVVPKRQRASASSRNAAPREKPSAASR